MRCRWSGIGTGIDALDDLVMKRSLLLVLVSMTTAFGVGVVISRLPAIRLPLAPAVPPKPSVTCRAQ